MGIVVYEKPTCTTCRNLFRLLEAEGIDFESVEYHVTGLTEDEIRGLLGKAGITAAEALRMREEGARELAGEDEDTIIAAMAERPELLQRPFVVNGERAVLARPVERALEVI
ncbi:MAG TPA: ArsC/Spx/MgsR family protein [Solirubrobacterales bacterium]|nr:ArsC/Spx/MgsR family protein [Solirubrobacterales bacterium]HNE78514.1 ArsC/Spx/MgsR family protein [Solirubrobacterales bacterium]HNK36027.1 ArsC/Spx/MgsR family protein [Solirubrobacterales bacterium]HNN20486.1 ArsC/Spx/MgsR family protein [Solirubrobacterales bacterium]HNO97801.1 ArsC/Spx/MgsR family protein [Solirubrobacterales bacterium]